MKRPTKTAEELDVVTDRHNHAYLLCAGVTAAIKRRMRRRERREARRELRREALDGWTN